MLHLLLWSPTCRLGTQWGLILDSWEDIYLPRRLALHIFPVRIYLVNSLSQNWLLSQVQSTIHIITQQGAWNDMTKRLALSHQISRFCIESFNFLTLGLGQHGIHKKQLQAIIYNYVGFSAQMFYLFFLLFLDVGWCRIERRTKIAATVFGWKINVTKWIICGDTPVVQIFISLHLTGINNTI